MDLAREKTALALGDALHQAAASIGQGLFDPRANLAIIQKYNDPKRYASLILDAL